FCYTPFATVGDGVELVVVVFGGIGRFAKRSDTNLDKYAAGLSLVPAKRREFITRAGDGAARAGHDIRAIIYKIVNVVIGSIEPRSIVVVAGEFEAIDNARPIEAGALVVAVFRVRQVELGMQRTVGD